MGSTKVWLVLSGFLTRVVYIFLVSRLVGPVDPPVPIACVVGPSVCGGLGASWLWTCPGTWLQAVPGEPVSSGVPALTYSCPWTVWMDRPPSSVFMGPVCREFIMSG